MVCISDVEKWIFGQVNDDGCGGILVRKQKLESIESKSYPTLPYPTLESYNLTIHLTYTNLKSYNPTIPKSEPKM